MVDSALPAPLIAGADGAEIQQAFADYRRTGFGGWPWDSPDPVYACDAGRFAHHADGRVEQPDAANSTAH